MYTGKALERNVPGMRFPSKYGNRGTRDALLPSFLGSTAIHCLIMEILWFGSPWRVLEGVHGDHASVDFPSRTAVSTSTNYLSTGGGRKCLRLRVRKMNSM